MATQESGSWIRVKPTSHRHTHSQSKPHTPASTSLPSIASRDSHEQTAMAFRGNFFALLGESNDDDVESLLARVAAPAAKAEERRSNGQKPPGSFDHGKGREQGNGSERRNRNGGERYNGQENGSWRSNRRGVGFKQNNGYRQDNRANGFKHNERQANGYKRNGTNDHQPRNGFGSHGNETEDKQNNESQRTKRDSGRLVENLRLSTEINVYEDDKDNRTRNSTAGGYGRGNKVDFYRRRGAAEGRNDNGDTNAEGDVEAAEASDESESKNGKHDQVLSQEEAERLAERELEAKRMTLKEYEKQLQEKRKVLESLKMKERKVTPDKEFESMQIVDKKSRESNSVKPDSSSDKVKNNVTMDKDEHKVHKPLVTNFKPAGANYSGRRGGRYAGYEVNGNGREAGGYNRSTVKKADAPPSFEDDKQFPALGG